MDNERISMKRSIRSVDTGPLGAVGERMNGSFGFNWVQSHIISCGNKGTAITLFVR